MATSAANAGWGKCARCGAPLPSIIMRGPCDACLEKDKVRARVERESSAERLSQHPDLADVEAVMEQFDRVWNEWRPS